MTDEMTPQQAAAVWAQVPTVDHELTPRVMGLSDVLTGLAIVAFAAPGFVVVTGSDWGPFTFLWMILAMVALPLLFLLLRDGLWKVYGLARPTSPLASMFARRSYKTVYVWWFLAPVIWWIVTIVITNVLDPVGDGPVKARDDLLTRSASYTLFLCVYTIIGGHWESQQRLGRRPYLLVIGVVASAIAYGLTLAFHDGDAYGTFVLGAAWLLSGFLLYRQV